jgi:hypothetical protein
MQQAIAAQKYRNDKICKAGHFRLAALLRSQTEAYCFSVGTFVPKTAQLSLPKRFGYAISIVGFQKRNSRDALKGASLGVNDVLDSAISVNGELL